MVRHTLATLAYRAGKVLRGAPPQFATFRASEDTRTPGEILAHLGDLMEWALSLANAAPKWQASEPIGWEAGVARFYIAIEALDARLASPDPIPSTPEKLFQGPIADALTHVGQLAMLRRMAGAPVKGENYFVAAISAGSVGSHQAAPRLEFE
jgi:hypothetical protein